MHSMFPFHVVSCLKKSEALTDLRGPDGAVAVWKVDRSRLVGWRWRVARWDRGEVKGWARTESEARQQAWAQVDAAHAAARAA